VGKLSGYVTSHPGRLSLAIHSWVCDCVVVVEEEEEERDFRIDSKVLCEGAHPLYGTLSRRGLNPNKLAYDPHRLDVQLLLIYAMYSGTGGRFCIKLGL